MSVAGVLAWMSRSWAFLRDLTGDAAYEAHEARARARHEPPQSREAFYLDGLHRRYSRPNRCC